MEEAAKRGESLRGESEVLTAGEFLAALRKDVLCEGGSLTADLMILYRKDINHLLDGKVVKIRCEDAEGNESKEPTYVLMRE